MFADLCSGSDNIWTSSILLDSTNGGTATNCEAKGPELNNKFCTGYTHKRWNAGDEDDEGDPNQDYPGEEVRRNAYIRLVENHKDKVFHNKEEAESKRRRRQEDTHHEENETDTQEYGLIIENEQEDQEGKQHNTEQEEHQSIMDEANAETQ